MGCLPAYRGFDPLPYIPLFERGSIGCLLRGIPIPPIVPCFKKTLFAKGYTNGAASGKDNHDTITNWWFQAFLTILVSWEVVITNRMRLMCLSSLANWPRRGM